MLSTVIVFFAYVFAATARWLTRKFGVVTIDQIIYHLNMPVDAEEKLIKSYFSNTWLAAIGAALVFYMLVARVYKKSPDWHKKVQAYSLRIAFALLAVSLLYSGIKMQVQDMWSQYKRFNTVSTFFEDNYISHNKKAVAPKSKNRY